MDSKGQVGMTQVALAALVFLFILAILGQFLSVFTGTIVNSNTGNATLIPGFTNGVLALTNLIPLVLVGALLVGIALYALARRG